MPERESRLTPLSAISPIDGRYREKVKELAPFFSETGLIRTRVEIEARYLVALSDIGVVRPLTSKERKKLESLGPQMSTKDAQRVKEIEDETRHDVKAMERVFREKVAGTSLEDITEMIHFGLTSEDVNNLSYRLMLDRANKQVMQPTLNKIADTLADRAEEYAGITMLGRTHGQAAIPTTVGKEFVNTGMRLRRQINEIEGEQLTGKLNGAIGNFNAHHLSRPDVDWIAFSAAFVSSLGLEPNLYSTQINPYDDVIALFQAYQRVNNIFIDFDQDMWRYISDDWFVQEARKGEVGSSTMPQKVNPIDFENSEGNLGLANAMIEFFTRKLSVSRLQRDLSDSTVIRNFGTVFAYQLLAYKNTLLGLSKVKPNEEQIERALNHNWAILTEGVQTVLRTAGVENAYDLIKGLSRGQRIGPKEWKLWVNGLPVSEDVKKTLLSLKPLNYLGLVHELTEMGVDEIRNQ
ncbi:adenylosuccinate lyase [Candidatus Woesebacteria bacterium]|jgi:adenylosuccinate lyase|nr:adenylosuccinate lyase [Candidatus Woesebacteria bacterium]